MTARPAAVCNSGSAVDRVMKAKLVLVLAVLEVAAVLPAMAQMDMPSELHQCRNSKGFLEKINHCSNIIARSRNRTSLEIAYNSRGFAFIEAQRFIDAANDFSAVINLNPSIAGYYDNRQNAYRSAGRFQDALNDANNAIRLAPTYSFVYRGRGSVYNDMGQYSVALSDYTQAIQISPGDGGLFIDRGKIFVRMGRLQEAISDFSHALELDTKWTAAFRERGLAFKQVGQIDAALRDLTVFVQLEPGDRGAARALMDLQNAKAVLNGPTTMQVLPAAPSGGQPQTQTAPTAPPTLAQEVGSNRSESEVQLQKSGGTFVIPVSINGALTLNFIIDSGAADVSIPADVVLTLMRTGTLRSEDFLGSTTYELADGSTVPSETFRIRSLRVGDREIENITGSVAKIEGHLLLGQSFLSRFKSWSIDNERGVLLLR
jgi:clan AA aspartic protease (TIGR02281 family)